MGLETNNIKQKQRIIKPFDTSELSFNYMN